MPLLSREPNEKDGVSNDPEEGVEEWWKRA
jgi:hypothetical protein